MEVWQLVASHLAEHETMEANMAKLVKLTLADTLEQPINALNIEEVCGRVYLVRYRLYKQTDTVLPIIIGWHSCSFRTAFKKMSSHLDSWRAGTDQEIWYQKGKQLTSMFLASLRDVVDSNEYGFINNHLYHALADPKAYQ